MTSTGEGIINPKGGLKLPRRPNDITTVKEKEMSTAIRELGLQIRFYPKPPY